MRSQNKLSVLSNKKDIDECFGICTLDGMESEFKKCLREEKGKDYLTQYDRSDIYTMTSSAMFDSSGLRKSYQNFSRVNATSSIRDYRNPILQNLKAMYFNDKHSLKTFRINTKKLWRMKNEAKMIEYVKDCLVKKFKKDMRVFFKNHPKESYENKENSHIKKIENGPKDVFSWIKINTEFKGLRKKLHQRLIEVITDETSFKNFDINLKRRRQDAPSESEEEESKTYESAFLRHRSVPFLIKRKAVKKSQKHLDTLIKSRLRKSSKKEILEKQESTAEFKQFNWDLKVETNYNQDKKSSKALFMKGSRGAHFIDVSNKNNYQKIKNTSKKANLREFLLFRFMDRQWISDEELRYLTYTSELNSKCLNKKFYQKAINSISIEVKSDIEMLIAEEILNES